MARVEISVDPLADTPAGRKEFDRLWKEEVRKEKDAKQKLKKLKQSNPTLWKPMSWGRQKRLPFAAKQAEHVQQEEYDKIPKTQFEFAEQLREEKGFPEQSARRYTKQMTERVSEDDARTLAEQHGIEWDDKLWDAMEKDTDKSVSLSELLVRWETKAAAADVYTAASNADIALNKRREIPALSNRSAPGLAWSIKDVHDARRVELKLKYNDPSQLLHMDATIIGWDPNTGEHTLEFDRPNFSSPTSFGKSNKTKKFDLRGQNWGNERKTNDPWTQGQDWKVLVYHEDSERVPSGIMDAAALSSPPTTSAASVGDDPTDQAKELLGQYATGLVRSNDELHKLAGPEMEEVRNYLNRTRDSPVREEADYRNFSDREFKIRGTTRSPPTVVPVKVGTHTMPPPELWSVRIPKNNPLYKWRDVDQQERGEAKSTILGDQDENLRRQLALLWHKWQATNYGSSREGIAWDNIVRTMAEAVQKNYLPQPISFKVQTIIEKAAQRMEQFAYGQTSQTSGEHVRLLRATNENIAASDKKITTTVVEYLDKIALEFILKKTGEIDITIGNLTPGQKYNEPPNRMLALRADTGVDSKLSDDGSKLDWLLELSFISAVPGHPTHPWKVDSQQQLHVDKIVNVIFSTDDHEGDGQLKSISTANNQLTILYYDEQHSPAPSAPTAFPTIASAVPGTEGGGGVLEAQESGDGTDVISTATVVDLPLHLVDEGNLKSLVIQSFGNPGNLLTVIATKAVLLAAGVAEDKFQGFQEPYQDWDDENRLWQKDVGIDGRSYFWNTADEATQWERPLGADAHELRNPNQPDANRGVTIKKTGPPELTSSNSPAPNGDVGLHVLVNPTPLDEEAGKRVVEIGGYGTYTDMQGNKVPNRYELMWTVRPEGDNIRDTEYSSGEQIIIPGFDFGQGGEGHTVLQNRVGLNAVEDYVKFRHPKTPLSKEEAIIKKEGGVNLRGEYTNIAEWRDIFKQIPLKAAAVRAFNAAGVISALATSPTSNMAIGTEDYVADGSGGGSVVGETLEEYFTYTPDVSPQEQYNQKYGYPAGTTHSVEDISKKTGRSVRSLTPGGAAEEQEPQKHAAGAPASPTSSPVFALSSPAAAEDPSQLPLATATAVTEWGETPSAPPRYPGQFEEKEYYSPAPFGGKTIRARRKQSRRKQSRRKKIRRKQSRRKKIRRKQSRRKQSRRKQSRRKQSRRKQFRHKQSRRKRNIHNRTRHKRSRHNRTRHKRSRHKRSRH